ncbi:MAG TPA: hypothetical protein VFC04_05485 [Actinomycetota bacterium]|nr:hypothetical protein [Actinomycetota bacterium]
MDAHLYLERLSDRDLAFLGRVAGGFGGPAEAAARLRAEPARIDELIGRSEVFDALFAPWSDHPFVHASPFLVFSVLLAATARMLEDAPFVWEWIGPRQRLPVFAVDPLRRFLHGVGRRVLLADLLASYTHVASGVVWVRGRRGWARRRFNELDPGRLAGLLDVVAPAERPAVYRRLGDLALFLSGVFPDFAAERLFRPVQVERLERLLEQMRDGPEEGEPESPPGGIGLLERLGRRSYRMALAAVPGPRTDLGRALEEIAGEFSKARRVLNVLTDTRLFPRREELFGFR